MPEPPPRKRFQIHLSTAMVMMCVAGGLMWTNLVPRSETIGVAYPPVERGETRKEHMRRARRATLEEFVRERKDYEWVGDKISKYGWPCDTRRVTIDGGMMASDLEWIGQKPVEDWRPHAILINALVAVAILFAVWFLCEWLIRRRAARA